MFGCETGNKTMFRPKKFSIWDNSYQIGSAIDRVPTSSGNHGKPGKSLKKNPCMEKSWNLKKTE